MTRLHTCLVHAGVLRLVAASALIVAVLAGQAAAASGFRVSPLRLDMSPQFGDTTLTITNASADPQTLQTRVFAWSQAGNTDSLQPTTDILFTPPIFSVASGESQVIRLRFRGGVHRSKLQSYRVYVEALPDAEPSDASGVAIRFRVGLPLFVAPLEISESQLEVKANAATGSGHRLQLTNRGEEALRVSGMAVLPADHPEGDAIQRLTQVSEGPVWLLPGSSQSWMVPAGHQAQGVMIEMQTPVDVATGAERRDARHLWIARLP